MAQGYTPPPLGPYEYHEVLSALRKEIKLDRPEQAIYWLNVLLTYGGSPAPKSAAKQLWIMSAEDIDDQAVVMRAFAVYQMSTVVSEADNLYFLVFQMCRARKWWEHHDGREVDRLWAKAIGDLKVAERNLPIPGYALDRHTRRGWAIFKQSGQFDDRFSGTDLGRTKTCYLLDRDGRISPDGYVTRFSNGEPDDGFLEAWAKRRALQAMSANDLEPNDPLGRSNTVPEAGMLFDAGEPEQARSDDRPRFD